MQKRRVSTAPVDPVRRSDPDATCVAKLFGKLRLPKIGIQRVERVTLRTSKRIAQRFDADASQRCNRMELSAHLRFARIIFGSRNRIRRLSNSIHAVVFREKLL